jgi:hypothetical protein
MSVQRRIRIPKPVHAPTVSNREAGPALPNKSLMQWYAERKARTALFGALADDTPRAGLVNPAR